jgi:hypothetical protein
VTQVSRGPVQNGFNEAHNASLELISRASFSEQVACQIGTILQRMKEPRKSLQNYKIQVEVFHPFKSSLTKSVFDLRHWRAVVFVIVARGTYLAAVLSDR